MAETPRDSGTGAEPSGGATATGDGRGIYVGHGDSIVRIGPLEHSANIATVTHHGEGSFVVRSVDRRNEEIDLLVDTAGPYSGVVPLDFNADPRWLHISATGCWTIEVAPLSSADRWDGTDVFTATGDRVVQIADLVAEDLPAHLTCDGGYCFSVWAWGDRRELLLDHDAPFEGTVEIPADAVVLAVQAQGAWTISA